MRTLGIDYGRRRLGLALSDEDGLLASPVPARLRSGLDEDLAFLADLARERAVAQVVIGLPQNMNGSLGEMALEVLAFARTLEEKLNLRVIPFDERLTSSEAERVLIQADLSRRQRRGLRDGLAAVLILQSYLDSLRANSRPSTPGQDSA
jgi:putative Holliday junction resolvase